MMARTTTSTTAKKLHHRRVFFVVVICCLMPIAIQAWPRTVASSASSSSSTPASARTTTTSKSTASKLALLRAGFAASHQRGHSIIPVRNGPHRISSKPLSMVISSKTLSRRQAAVVSSNKNSSSSNNKSKRLHSTERYYAAVDASSTLFMPLPGRPIAISPPASVGIDAAVAPSHKVPAAAASLLRLQSWWSNMDTVAFLTYLANVVTVSMPVLLLPSAASELATRMSTTTSATSLIASMTAIASLGGAVGKFTNGFVLSHSPLSPHSCSMYYMMGLSLCSLWLSLAPTPITMALAFAGMEFFASMQWTALTVMLSTNHEEAQQKGGTTSSVAANLARSMTKLGLSSTLGQVLSKVIGTTLLSLTSWRMAAKMGSGVAVLGAVVVGCNKNNKQQQQTSVPTQRLQPVSAAASFRSILASLRDVLGRPIFWMVGLAHAAAYLARSSDRILGAFFHHSTAFPQSICGGLTLSVTLGLIHGLIRGERNFAIDKDDKHKSKFLSKCYATAVASAVGLAGLAHYGSAMIPSTMLMSLLVALLSGSMASSLSFQYFQVPSILGERFGKNKAVCISFLDGMGFLLAAPVWATTSRMVPSFGWVSAWTLLAGLFGMGGILMMQALPSVLDSNKDKRDYKHR